MLWPALASTVMVACVTLLSGLPGLVSFLLIPVSLLGYLIAVLALVGSAAVFAAKRRPRRATSMMLALLTPIFLWVPINWAADCLHIGLTVGSKPADNQFAVYDWSTGLAGGSETFLIYDKSDEIARPQSLHKRPASSEHGFGEACAGKVKHLVAHYYLCRF